MQYSQNGFNLTKNFESCRLTAYLDVRGVPTIGWGHTGPDVHEGLVWTQEQADAALAQDMQHAEDCVNRLLTVQVSQSQFDAMVDLVFNIGCDAFSSSTLLKLVNEGNFPEAALQFDRWSYAAGHIVPGLLRRREAETSEFDSQSFA